MQFHLLNKIFGSLFLSLFILCTVLGPLPAQAADSAFYVDPQTNAAKWVAANPTAAAKLAAYGALGSAAMLAAFVALSRASGPALLGDGTAVAHTLSIPELARTSFAIETSVVSISPTSGPPGTPVTIHLKGVGWTDFDNIYVATYDNAYMGYACGFNSQGDVVVNFTAVNPTGSGNLRAWACGCIMPAP